MKIFIYKSLIVFILFFLGFHLTFNYVQKTIERKIYNLTTKANIEIIKDSARKSINEILKKDNLINADDEILLKTLIEKIKKEIYN
jgi:cell division protein YceG involved in septum cleavage